MKTSKASQSTQPKNLASILMKSCMHARNLTIDTLTVTHLAFLAHVKLQPLQPMEDIAKALIVEPAHVSRMCRLFGKKGLGGRKGMGFIQFKEDPLNNRIKRVSLTKKGEDFWNTLINEGE